MTIKAEIVTDSISPARSRLTTFSLRYPRFIHAEFMTHRMFCLSGETLLEFDLPASLKNDSRRMFKMTLKAFYEKWHHGAQGRENKKKRTLDLHLIDPQKSYSSIELAELLEYSKHAIHAACRNKTLVATKNDSNQWLVFGQDFIDWRTQNVSSNRYHLQTRLSKMKIRQLNEYTNKIENTNITNVFYSGEKEVFEIIVGNTRLVGSKDHKILTLDGWKTIEQLVPNKDFIITSKFGKLEQDLLDPIRLKKIDGKWKSTYLNQVRNQVLEIQQNQCYDCACALANIKHELHHIVPVLKDSSLTFDVQNIAALCVECHHKRHSVQGWQGGTYLYGHPVLLESVTSLGVQDTYDLSVAGQYENFIANGIVTHNSRNASSSRAIPVDRILADIENDPATFVEWGLNQAGMQAHNVADEFTARAGQEVWLEMMRSVMDGVRTLQGMGFHKQIVNRALEPWSHISVVVTATDWDNFFGLRCHPDAQPEIKVLSEQMRDLYFQNTPSRVDYGGWHLPFIKDEERYAPGNYGKQGRLKNEAHLVKASVARCARVSYKTHDKKDPDIEVDATLHDRLFESQHFSPFEHPAQPLTDPNQRSGNFKGWVQYRQMLKNNVIANYEPPK